MQHTQSKRGFTLVELLVVIAIIGILLAILLPALARARATAKATRDATQVKQIHSGWLSFAVQNDGLFPTPGLKRRLPVNGQLIMGRGAEDVTQNNHANVHSLCVMENLYPPDLMVSTAEKQSLLELLNPYERLQRLHDQSVILARVDESAVLANRVANRFVLAAVALLQRSDPRRRLAAPFHGQLNKRIARTGGRRRAEHFDLGRRQARVNFGPRIIGVFDEFTFRVAWHLLRQRQENLLASQFHRRRTNRVGKYDAVIADLDFDDFCYTVCRTGLDL